MASKRKQQPGGGPGATGGAASGSYSRAGSVVSGLSPPRDDRKKPRRKDALSWDKYTSTPYLDGYLWRKYGNKIIKSSAFPRLYYRCSYHEDRHCMASKLIQQVNDDETPLYKVTYTCEHTCNASAPVPTLDVVAVAEAELPAAGDGLVLRFGSGRGHRDARMRQLEAGRPQYQQPISWRPLEMLSFDSCWNSKLQQQSVVLPSQVLPPDAAASSSVPTAESSPAALTVANDEDDVFPTWNSLRYGLEEDHLHLVPASSMFAWGTNTNITDDIDVHRHSWACTWTGTEEEVVF